MLVLLALVTGLFHGNDVLISGSASMQAIMQTSAAPHGATHLDIWETANGITVRTYDLNMTKKLHLVVVSDDQRVFEHIHPVLHANGHFTIDVDPIPHGLYHLYADGDPHGYGRQVFRFDAPIGSDHIAPTRVAHAAGTTMHAGPYLVRLDSTTVAPGDVATLRVTILKNGKPATDLHPYLGAVAHGVFVGLDDLAYMHGHGMDAAMMAMADANDCGDAMMAAMPPLAPSASVPSSFAMQLLAPRAQRYNFWLQFTGGDTLYTVPFLVTAR